MSAYQDISALTALGCSEVKLRSASGECFPGQYHDKETSLHYNHFRYYDPSIGRYITSDPIGLLGAINSYGYVEANPVLLADPDGRIPILLIPVAVRIAGGVVGATVGGISGASSAQLSGQSVVLGFAAGALAGGVVGTLGPSGVVMTLGANAAVAGTIDAAFQLFGDESFDSQRLGKQTLEAAIAGAAGNVVAFRSALLAYRTNQSLARALIAGESIGAGIAAGIDRFIEECL